MCKLTISEFADILTVIILVLTLAVSLLTLIVLYCNLSQFWKQNSLTQLLNRPFCSVKQIKVEVLTVPPSTDVISVSAIITNSGNDYARDVVITREAYAIDKKTGVKTSLVLKESQEKITILPKQELEAFLLYIQKGKFNDLVGGYDRVALLEMTIQYKDMNEKVLRYSCTYSITKLLTDRKDVNVYEIFLQNSSLETP